MARPKKERIVHTPPIFQEFKPTGVPGKFLNQVKISLDEYEAFRLADHLGLSHEEAAIEMEISRSTFTRLIEKSRKKIADLIINGKMLIIEGGNIHFKRNLIRCFECGHLFIIKIADPVSQCPECNSDKLLNLAGGFGHGKCCVKRGKPNK